MGRIALQIRDPQALGFSWDDENGGYKLVHGEDDNIERFGQDHADVESPTLSSEVAIVDSEAYRRVHDLKENCLRDSLHFGSLGISEENCAASEVCLIGGNQGMNLSSDVTGISRTSEKMQKFHVSDSMLLQ